MSKPIKDHVSAGGILLNLDKTKAYLIFKNSRKHWQIPKGHQEEKETLQETAIREIQEETGYTSFQLIKTPKVSIGYDFELEREPEFRHHKKVYFFLAQLKNMHRKENTQEENEGLAGDWIPIENVVEKLTHKEERDAARKLLK